MSLHRLDQSKPPPGWFTVNGHTAQQWQRAVVPLEKAWKKYTEDSAPAVDDALARLVEWLRECDFKVAAATIEGQPLADAVATTAKAILADAIESGEWRK